MKILTLLLLSLLSACASAIMKSYVGKDVREAILDYGPPANIMDMGKDRRAYQWHMNQNFFTPGYSNTTSTGYAHIYGNNISGSSASHTTSMPAMMGSQSCFYTLYAENHDAESWIVTDFRAPSLMCE